jgi:integrase/recombinase XerD
VVEPFADDQVRALLTAAPNALVITLRALLDTGVRISEAVGLDVGDVGDGYLRVRGKGGHERLVPIGRELDSALRRYVSRERRSRTARPDESLLLQRSGRPQTASGIYHAMRRLADDVGVSGVRVSPHTCRHTFAINFLRNGGNLLALQRILGHRDLAMVRRYAEVTDADIMAAQAIASPLDRWSRTQAGASWR